MADELKQEEYGGAGAAQHKKLPWVIAACAIVVAVAVGVFHIATAAPAGTAATVDGVAISESEVASYIDQYRTGHSLTEDADFAAALVSSNYNINTFRQSAINQLVMDKLIEARAEELGVTPTEDEITAQVDQMKENLGVTDDEMWQLTLESQNMSEQDLRDECESSLAQSAVLEQDVEQRDATDSEVISYIANDVTVKELRHSYRIAFTGDDQAKKGKQLYKELKAASSVDATSFSELATTLSEEEDAASTGGSYGWSDATDMSDTYREALETLDAGEFSKPVTLSDESMTVVIFCDTYFTFADSSELADTTKDDYPEDVWEYLADQAADDVWESDCNMYLLQMMSAASITYYPTPADASYNINLIEAMDTAAEESESTE